MSPSPDAISWDDSDTGVASAKWLLLSASVVLLRATPRASHRDDSISAMLVVRSRCDCRLSTTPLTGVPSFVSFFSVSGVSSWAEDRSDVRVARVDVRRRVGFSSFDAFSLLLDVSERLFSGVSSCSGVSSPMVSSTTTCCSWIWCGISEIAADATETPTPVPALSMVSARIPPESWMQKQQNSTRR